MKYDKIKIIFTKFKYIFLVSKISVLKVGKNALLIFCVRGEKNRGIKFAPWTLV